MASARGDAGRFGAGAKDETGKVYGSLRVVRRAPNVNGSARWLCMCGNCGGQEVVTGTQLRAGNKTRCSKCRPRSPGTVRRKTTD